ncbi:SAM-dependent methyltransferase [Aestuariivivens sediminis]|uniref:SAM-dependent methyltransferase n=1 Tax=Aestuariivivens sediminis TaxID=2913557 RepID=UPI001F5AC45D|nr:class I SAM-dependent methyltransferase [Aestuariivivens sediminis]
MELIKNDAVVWDEIWDAHVTEDYDSLNKKLVQTKNSAAWKKYSQIITDNFGGWQNVNAIEIGSGMGWYSFVAASEGANVTLIDYSEGALRLAQIRFEMFSFEANFIFGNAFDLLKEVNTRYNLSWSFGTAEHYKNELRQEFFELHFNCLENNGITIISCPYKFAINYRLWMHYAIKYNNWSFGLEIPYSKREYIKRLKQSGNSLVKICFQEGRPCLNKLLSILRQNSKWRFYIFYPFVKLVHKFNLKISPFNYRSVILIAAKTK